MNFLRVNMIKNQKKKILFLSNFLEKEWILNGHSKNDLSILYLFENLIPHIKKGKYLELGCGSGILCKFLFLFSNKNITLYGVDINPIAIKLAKKNNPKFSDNFMVSDYFNLKAKFFSKYSTIVIFVNHYRNEWDELKKMISSIIKSNKNPHILVIDYDYDYLIDSKNSKIVKFISYVKKISNIDFNNKRFFIITKKTNLKKDNKDKLIKSKQKRILKKNILDGTIVKKEKNLLILRLKRKNKKIKVLLTKETIFFEKELSIPSHSISSAKKIKNQDIKNRNTASLVVSLKDNTYTALIVQKIIVIHDNE